MKLLSQRDLQYQRPTIHQRTQTWDNLEQHNS